MSPYWAVLVTLLSSALGAWITYTPWLLHAAWAPWVLTLLCASGGPLWTWAARRIPAPAELVYFSLLWDGALAVGYYVLPLLFLAATGFASGRLALGVLLVVLGLAVAKSALPG